MQREGLSIAEKKLSPQQKYDKVNAKVYTIKVIRTTESDIIQKLDGQKNKAGYIKALIREDIAKNNNK